MSNEIQSQPNPLENPTATKAIPAAQTNNLREDQWTGVLNEFDEKLAQNSIGETKSTLPQVIIPGGSISITKSSEALFRIIAPQKQLFYRGGVVVDLHKEDDEYEVEVLDAVSAQSRFEKYVYFVKLDKDGKSVSPANISEPIARQYLKSEAPRKILPKLNGILHCPLLVEKKGKLHRIEHGYDETTGFFLATDIKVETIELEEAVEFLKGTLQDFDFVTGGDRSRAIASLITPALIFGGLIKGPIPVDVAEADMSQSGKTYRQKLVAALYNQKVAVVTQKTGGVGSMDETFGAQLIKGKAFIQFDNVRGRIDSKYLESFITAEDTITARIPHGGNVAVDPSKFILFISSNGFESSKDLANRASIIRIRKRENYIFKTDEKGQDILGATGEYLPVLIGSLFAVVEEWFKKGKPRTNDLRHSFREWSQSLDWIVQHIFNEKPLMDGHAEAKQRASNPQLSFLRLVSVQLRDEKKLGQKQTASDIARLSIDSGYEIPGLAKDKQDIEGGRKVVGAIMAKLFEGKMEFTFEEFKVTKDVETVQTGAGNTQQQIQYTFNAVSAPIALTAESVAKP